MDRPEPAVTSGDDYRTIPALLAWQAREHGSAAAIAGLDGRLNYAELHDAAREVTRAVVAAGLRPGEAAVIWAPNSARWIVTALGLLGAGAVLVPIGTRLRGPEAADILARSHSRLLFTVRGFLGTDYVRMLTESGCALPDITQLVLLSNEPQASEIDSAAPPTTVPHDHRPAPSHRGPSSSNPPPEQPFPRPIDAPRPSLPTTSPISSSPPAPPGRPRAYSLPTVKPSKSSSNGLPRSDCCPATATCWSIPSHTPSDSRPGSWPACCGPHAWCRSPISIPQRSPS